MRLLGVVLGAIVGGALWGSAGMLIGAVLGFALAPIIAQQLQPSRLTAIESELAQLRDRLARLEQRQAESPDGSFDTAAVVTPASVEAPQPVEPTIDAGVGTGPKHTPSQSASAVQGKTVSRSAPSARRKPVSAGPSPLSQWLFGGNAMVRIGIVVLFFGVAFLVKYAAEHTTVPIELRLVGVALGAIVMLALGWRWRERNGAYGLVLQGGGIGVLYLVIFAAYRIWQVLPSAFTLVLLIAVAVLSAMLAVLQNAPALAIAGATGGFLAPVLASTGTGSHIALFSYYLVLNLGLLGIAWFKAWRVLNVVGFLFTFGVGALWGARNYHPELYVSTQIFLVAFFLLYVGMALLFALRRAPALRHYVDATLVFGTPVVVFGLQTQLVEPYEFGLAWSAVALALFYLVVAKVLWRAQRETLRMLVEALLALGVVFGTLAVPLALDGRWTATAWALEGLGMIWVGARQGRMLPRAFGTLLQFAAGAAFVLDGAPIERALPVFNGGCLGALLIGAAGVAAARLLMSTTGKMARAAALGLLVWGSIWWIGGGFAEIDVQFMRPQSDSMMLIYGAGSALLLGALGTRWQWGAARLASIALLVSLLPLFAGLMWLEGRTPVPHYGWLAWPLGFGATYYLLRRHESLAPEGLASTLHCLLLWLLVALLVWESGMRVEQWVGGGRIWSLVMWPLIPALTTLFLASGTAMRRWPVAQHERAYVLYGGGALLAYVYGWAWYANFSTSANPAPLPYVPLLNPLDLTILVLALAVARWLLRLRDFKAGTLRELALPAVGALAFVWANAVLLRTLHHYAGVGFDLQIMLRSTLVQAALSLFWTALALGCMVWARRRGTRAVWAVGAMLLAVVVAKLFFLDLSRISGLERIVSFLGVGALMLVIGYVAPVPPRAKEVG